MSEYGLCLSCGKTVKKPVRDGSLLFCSLRCHYNYGGGIETICTIYHISARAEKRLNVLKNKEARRMKKDGILAMAGGGTKQADIAKHYNVSKQYISKLIKQNLKEVENPA